MNLLLHQILSIYIKKIKLLLGGGGHNDMFAPSHFHIKKTEPLSIRYII